MKILFILELLFLVLAFPVSKKKYTSKVNKIYQEHNRFKGLLPIGMYILNLFKHKYNSNYERKLEAKLRELGGITDARELLQIHMAEKIAIMLTGILFITFIGIQINIDTNYIIFALVLEGLLFYYSDKQIDTKVRNRRRSIQIEFPEFLNKLVLLVNAGMTVSAAIRKIIKENKKHTPLYEELLKAINDIDSGKPEINSFEDFAARCRLQEAAMFVTALVQNLRKGNDELVPILNIQSNTCWQNRKNMARKLGEEASAKLVLPMMIIFIAIVIMVMAPAVMQIKF